MSAPRLLITSTQVPLLTDKEIISFEGRTQTAAKVETDISGQPMVTTLELSGSNSSFSMTAPYQELVVIQACNAAYNEDSQLSLIDELGLVTQVSIIERPVVVRHKREDCTVAYTITLSLQSNESTLQIPTISTNGPRLFN